MTTQVAAAASAAATPTPNLSHHRHHRHSHCRRRCRGCCHRRTSLPEPPGPMVHQHRRRQQQQHHHHHRLTSTPQSQPQPQPQPPAPPPPAMSSTAVTRTSSSSSRSFTGHYRDHHYQDDAQTCNEQTLAVPWHSPRKMHPDPVDAQLNVDTHLWQHSQQHTLLNVQSEQSDLLQNGLKLGSSTIPLPSQLCPAHRHRSTS